MAEELKLDGVRTWIPARPEDGHKGTFGHVFVLAGSRGFTGAAKLACEAAARSGAGLVTLGIPHPLADLFAASMTEVMSLRLASTEAETLSADALDMALEFAKEKQAILIGPGLSRNSETAQFILDFLPQSPAPLVIDADGLNALSEQPSLLHDIRPDCILTPHPGEMARLTGLSAKEIQEDRERVTAKYAQTWNCVVVLKGHRSVIAGPDGQTAVNTTGNHGLGTGGTGDVLSGLLAGLLAQGMAPFEAAGLGVYLHGLAGDIAAEQFTPRAMLAGDVLRALPEAWKRLEDTRPQRAGFLGR